MRAKKLAEFGVSNRALRNRIRPVSEIFRGRPNGSGRLAQHLGKLLDFLLFLKVTHTLQKQQSAKHWSPHASEFRAGIGEQSGLARGDPSYARDSDLFSVPLFLCPRYKKRGHAEGSRRARTRLLRTGSFPSLQLLLAASCPLPLGLPAAALHHLLVAPDAWCAIPAQALPADASCLTWLVGRTQVLVGLSEWLPNSFQGILEKQTACS